jgi:dihydroorotate dehydrogenase
MRSRKKNINNKKSNPKPILLKIAPDLNEQELDDIVEDLKTFADKVKKVE